MVTSSQFRRANACLLAQKSKTDLTRPEMSVAHVYEKDVVIKKFRDDVVSGGRRGGGKRADIFKFSDASKRRLLFVCRNSGSRVKSQVCLTFHRSSPIDGRAFKETLNLFLTRLRQKYSGVHYLWVLEFQKNGQPHAHMFTDIEPTEENRHEVARIWNTATKESEENYKFTSHHRNFFKWVMDSGSYLAKEYLAKSIQKDVPEHFRNVGRFWGCSRNMKPEYVKLEPEKEVDTRLMIMAVRATFKCYEKKLSKYIGKKINLRSRQVTKTLPSMANVFIEAIKHYWWFNPDYVGTYHQAKDYAVIPSFEYGVPF